MVSETLSKMIEQFALRISAEEMQRYYAGAARVVIVRAESGRRIQFSAEHLRQFVSSTGIAGWFEIEYDGKGKFIRIDCLKRFVDV